MNAYDRLPDAAAEIFGEGATAERTYDLLTVDVPAESWIPALETARDQLGCTYFDWLSAVDEPGTGFRVCAHVVALEGGTVRRLLVRTTVPRDAAVLPTAVGVYAGAGWHERETHEMFGVSFSGHPHLVPLLLPERFEGHPLRKDFVLAARVVKAWPGAKEPGESEHGGPKRRQMLPPGVPDPNEWGPLKGQLPPAPARPARGARGAGGGGTGGGGAGGGGAGGGGAGGGGAAGERPVRRARSVTQGSASQQPEGTTPDAPWRKPPPATEDNASTTESPESESPESEGPRSEGPRSEGPRSEGPRGEGTESEGTESESPQSEGPESDRRPEGDA
ncbi:NADH-quinone oxidoreductase subunit C [Streptomyces scopuliridis]